MNKETKGTESFDTYAAVKKLESVGLEEKQAATIVEVVSLAVTSAVTAATAQYATKVEMMRWGFGLIAFNIGATGLMLQLWG